MSFAPVECSKCHRPLPAESYNTDLFHPCDCGMASKTYVFPALIRPPPQGARAEALLMDDDASCFFHDQNRAEVPCDACGRFLCRLCDIALEGQHLCPECVAKGRKKGRLKTLQTDHILYDSLALMLAVLPLLMFWFTLFTAPAALFLAIRYWNKPCGLVPRSKARFVAAILFATAQIIGWFVFAASFFLDF